ncbi:MAG: hypothetical protein H0V47_08410 [Chloroflexia bacterium]|nr:hypothetical protein [Chloroflexia bacterium]
MPQEQIEIAEWPDNLGHGADGYNGDEWTNEEAAVGSPFFPDASSGCRSARHR